MSSSLKKFCYSKDINNHNAYPKSLIQAPPKGWNYRPTTICYDRELGRPWAFYDIAPNEIIHASSLIPTNNVSWIFDTDHIEYVLMQIELPSNSVDKLSFRYMAEERIVSALLSPDCKGVLAWSEASKHSVINLCHRYSVSSPKTIVLYPAVIEPLPAIAALSSGAISNLFRALMPHTVKLLAIDAQLGVCYNNGRKNIADAVKCFKRLRRSGHPVELIVVSPVEKINARDEGLHILPRLSRYDLWQLYKVVDILLFLSKQDSFGFVLMEAMYNGVCCIATTGDSLPAVSELIDHGKTGFLVNYFAEEEYPGLSQDIDFEKLFNYVECLLESKEIREEIAIKAKQQFLPGGRFSIQMRNRNLYKFLESIEL